MASHAEVPAFPEAHFTICFRTASISARSAIGNSGTRDCMKELFHAGYNRRVLYRNGLAKCHGSFKDPAALMFEGPVDPEVAVLAARDKNGKLLGSIVNFACHPCHHGGDEVFSAGYPGQLLVADGRQAIGDGDRHT